MVLCWGPFARRAPPVVTPYGHPSLERLRAVLRKILRSQGLEAGRVARSGRIRYCGIAVSLVWANPHS